MSKNEKPSLVDFLAKLTAKNAANKENKQLDLFFPEPERDSQRFVPKEFGVTSLFRVAKKSDPRVNFTDALLANYHNYTIIYNGPELRQDDKAVLMTLVKLHSDKNIAVGADAEMTLSEVARKMGKKLDSPTYESIDKSLERLATGRLKIRYDDKDGDKAWYISGFLSYYSGVEIKTSVRGSRGLGDAVIHLGMDKRVYKMYESNMASLDWERHGNVESSMYHWLVTFYAHHSEPIPIAVSSLRELCGSRATPDSFKRTLRTAVERLVENGFFTEGYIDEKNMLHVKRSHS